MPAAAQDAPRPGASSTMVTVIPASAARQAMPRPMTPPPTTTTSAALCWAMGSILPPPALSGAGSNGRRPVAALSARWPGLPCTSSAYSSSRYATAERSDRGGRRHPAPASAPPGRLPGVRGGGPPAHRHRGGPPSPARGRGGAGRLGAAARRARAGAGRRPGRDPHGPPVLGPPDALRGRLRRAEVVGRLCLGLVRDHGRARRGGPGGHHLPGLRTAAGPAGRPQGAAARAVRRPLPGPGGPLVGRRGPDLLDHPAGLRPRARRAVGGGRGRAGRGAGRPGDDLAAGQGLVRGPAARRPPPAHARGGGRRLRRPRALRPVLGPGVAKVAPGGVVVDVLRPAGTARGGGGMGSDHTPADDIVYDLVSIQYHALQAGYTYGKYLEDAEGHDDVLAFVRMCQQEDAQRAVTCHQLLTQLTKDGGIG